MKLQRTPLVLLVTALLLGGFVYWQEVQGQSKQETAQQQPSKLFAFQESDVQTLSLTTPKQTLSFTKTPNSAASKSKASSSQQSKQSTRWLMTAPKKTAANDASVAYLLNLMATGSRQQTLTIPATKQAEFGFDPPLAIAEVKLANQQSHRILLGKPNFNRSGLYAQVDPPANPTGDLAVAVVSIDFENAVTRPLAEWTQQESGANPKNQQKLDESGTSLDKKPEE